MSISKAISQQMERTSWIRRMFETGIQLRRERGPEHVFDFSLGNPEVEPPSAVLDALKRVAAEDRPHAHGYMPNAGYPEVRETIANRLAARTGLPFSLADVIMTNGAAGALNTVLKSILDPGDEVILLNPYFPEYRFYVENHGGRVVLVETDDRFQLDLPRIARAITPRTKALILNSPNNPTGVVYPAEALRALDSLVRDPMIVISDEPYRSLTYDGLVPPEVPECIERCVVAWSWSKAMAIPGERIGYLAISPRLAEAAELRNACTFANRILGYINAPALWQRVVGEVPDATVDVAPYQQKRDLLCDGLSAMGYDAPRPQGSFYVFVKTPIPDDVEFIGLLQDEGILAVPGIGFGRPGYMRLSLTITKSEIERSLPAFAHALQCLLTPAL
ncbi:MAG TPA: pyridoxal phosphate-dependent aminotransferase [Candidatus Sulfopaludibacter sp.]|jgi:aspartate aminotransferase|nr:pyridoxal phosphate-dependent aminotransferase [Candidatus Sulfopaludibacter sp.]